MSQANITAEQRDKAVQTAIDGGSPCQYLREIGVANPSSAWYYIKKQLQKKDPARFALVPPPKNGGAKDAEKPANQKKQTITLVNEEGKEPFTEKDVKWLQGQMPGAEVRIQDNRICKPLKHSGLTVIGWSGDFGTYRFDGRNGYIDYESKDGDELSMTTDQWRYFIKELKTAAALMGVSL